LPCDLAFLYIDQECAPELIALPEIECHALSPIFAVEGDVAVERSIAKGNDEQKEL
jgi:hypothetical protein